jgi:hypothetical protein
VGLLVRRKSVLTQRTEFLRQCSLPALLPNSITAERLTYAGRGRTAIVLFGPTDF